MVGSVLLDLLEPRFIYGDFLNHFGVNAKTKFLELFRELLAVHKIDWRRAIAGSFLDGIARKSAGRNK